MVCTAEPGALRQALPARLLARANEVIESRCCLLRRMSPFLAHRVVRCAASIRQ